MLSFALLLVVVTAAPAHTASSYIDGIAARVGSQLVLWSEVIHSSRSQGLNTLAEGDAEQIRERLIEDLLVAQAAAETGSVIEEQQVLAAIDRFAAGNNLTRDQLQASVLQQGLQWDAYQEIVRRQLLRAEVVQAKIRNNVVVSQSDIESTYQQTYKAKPEVNLTLRPVAPTANADAIELGWLDPAEARDEIRAAVAAYISGATSGTKKIVINGNHYAIELNQKRLVGGPAIKEVEEQIRAQLFQERVEHAFRNWLANVKAQHFIQRMPIPSQVQSQLQP